MSDTNATREVSHHPDADRSGMSIAEQRRAVAAYLRAVEAYQASLVAKINREVEAYRRRHPDEVA